MAHQIACSIFIATPLVWASVSQSVRRINDISIVGASIIKSGGGFSNGNYVVGMCIMLEARAFLLNGAYLLTMQPVLWCCSSSLRVTLSYRPLVYLYCCFLPGFLSSCLLPLSPTLHGQTPITRRLRSVPLLSDQEPWQFHTGKWWDSNGTLLIYSHLQFLQSIMIYT